MAAGKVDRFFRLPGTGSETVRVPSRWWALAILAAIRCDDTAAPVVEVIVDPNRVEMAAGDSVQLQTRLMNAAGTEVRRQVIWSSSDSLVARVSADGVVVGVAGGEALIQAVFRNRNGGAAVQVTSVAGEGDRCSCR
jgi:hypothetical protein